MQRGGPGAPGFEFSAVSLNSKSSFVSWHLRGFIAFEEILIEVVIPLGTVRSRAKAFLLVSGTLPDTQHSLSFVRRKHKLPSPLEHYQEGGLPVLTLFLVMEVLLPVSLRAAVGEKMELPHSK